MGDIEEGGLTGTELSLEDLDARLALLERKMTELVENMDEPIKNKIKAITGGRRRSRRPKRSRRPRKSRRSRRSRRH